MIDKHIEAVFDGSSDAFADVDAYKNIWKHGHTKNYSLSLDRDSFLIK